MRIRPFACILFGSMALLGATDAPAQAWPTRTIKMIVPFASGGATDVIGRLMAQKLSEALGQTVIVENRAGAGSTVGTELTAKAAPDGYTIGMVANTSLVTAPMLYPNVAYRPIEDLTYLAMIGTFANVFTVRSDHPAKTFADFLAMARRAPGQLSYASAGQGSAGHLTGELLKSSASIDIQHIPYKGTAPATVDLLGGQIAAMFDGMPTATQQARAGKVRMLAVTGPQRVPTFPEVPTMNEVVPGVIGLAFFGLAAPAGLPAPIAERLQATIIAIIKNPDNAARLTDIGMNPSPLPAAEFVAFVQAEIRTWGPVVKAVGVKPN